MAVRHRTYFTCDYCGQLTLCDWLCLSSDSVMFVLVMWMSCHSLNNTSAVNLTIMWTVLVDIEVLWARMSWGCLWWGAGHKMVKRSSSAGGTVFWQGSNGGGALCMGTKISQTQIPSYMWSTVSCNQQLAMPVALVLLSSTFCHHYHGCCTRSAREAPSSSQNGCPYLMGFWHPIGDTSFTKMPPWSP